MIRHLIPRFSYGRWGGAALTIRASVNPYGFCDTGGCWMSERKLSVCLDDPRQVALWNTRSEQRWQPIEPPHPNEEQN